MVAKAGRRDQAGPRTSNIAPCPHNAKEEMPVCCRNPGGRMLTGSCHCGAAHWTLREIPGSITACNCTLCSRYGALWAYDYVDERIRLAGPVSAYTRDGRADPELNSLLSNVRLRPGLAWLAPRCRRSLPDRRQRQACAAGGRRRSPNRPFRWSRHIRGPAERWPLRARHVVLVSRIRCAKPVVRRPA